MFFFPPVFASASSREDTNRSMKKKEREREREKNSRLLLPLHTSTITNHLLSSVFSSLQTQGKCLCSIFSHKWKRDKVRRDREEEQEEKTDRCSCTINKCLLFEANEKKRFFFY